MASFRYIQKAMVRSGQSWLIVQDLPGTAVCRWGEGLAGGRGRKGLWDWTPKLRILLSVRVGRDSKLVQLANRPSSWCLMPLWMGRMLATGRAVATRKPRRWRTYILRSGYYRRCCCNVLMTLAFELIMTAARASFLWFSKLNILWWYRGRNRRSRIR